MHMQDRSIDRQSHFDASAVQSAYRAASAQEANALLQSSYAMAAGCIALLQRWEACQKLPGDVESSSAAGNLQKQQALQLCTIIIAGS